MNMASVAPKLTAQGCFVFNHWTIGFFEHDGYENDGGFINFFEGSHLVSALLSESFG